MNQILDTGDNKRKQRDIKKVIKIFSIFLLIFAICIIAVAVYTIIIKSRKNINKKPEININFNIEERILDLNITDDTGIKEIIYTLNDKETKLDLNNETEKNIKVDLPNGKNTFKIVVIDKDGEQKEYEELYEVGAKVDFAVEGNKVKVNITSNTKISYITYRWDDKEEKKEDINGVEYELEIDSPQEDGKHKLILVIVDEKNNTIEKTKEVIIDKPPTLTVTRSNEAFIIKAVDDIELKKAEIILNGEKLKDIEINNATWEYEVPFKDEGINKLIVRVYNLNNAMNEKKVLVDQTKI